MAPPAWFRRTLQRYGISFEEHQHPPVFTASHLAHSEHMTGRRVAKTVLLSVKDRPLMVVLPASCRLDLDRVRDVVGPDARLAREAEIQDWFPGCCLGAVPPLRLRKDQSVLMDRSLAHLGLIVMPAATPQDAALMRFRDWYRMVRPGVGRFAVPPRQAETPPAPVVLVVEDEAITNLMLCRLLKHAGFTCHGARDGGDALALAGALHPALILLDLMLPDMSGFDVYERLREQGMLRKTPVVVLTALDDEGTRQRSSQLGVDAFLVKPVPPEQLVEELSGALADAVSDGRGSSTIACRR
jgi:CheY-like chemotaxis protein/prolyl-tRNA editing enzyme YbaK/EbsC (Cys-tRNA(Pro) deacylase)